MGTDLFPLLWKVIKRLTQTGYCILGVTCDGGSLNGRLFQLHQLPDDSKDKIIYKALNPFTNEAEDILFFTDLPHPLKTIRNCFQSPIRNLWVSIYVLLS